jgi:DnaJ-class molecular chaperone
MKYICQECGGNGYISIDVSDDGLRAIYDDCPKCNSQGEIDEEVMAARETQRELGE